MPGQYENPITINQAIKNIDGRKFLLPAIQRKFVWSAQQICVLFDSLMRGYPINSFMMWNVTDGNIKAKYRFYDFLTNYCQRFNVSNKHIPTTSSSDDFKAVIDGQQRLTSLYVGLKGTYAYKRPRVWWPKAQDDSVLPPRKLYLDIAEELDVEASESLMKYDFQFLTNAEASKNNTKAHWFHVGEILNWPAVSTPSEVFFKLVMPYLAEHGLSSNIFAQETLTRLYQLVHHEKVIHYYTEESQELDTVLDVFIRTNSGGTSLSFSDLLMSIAVAHWKGDARDSIDKLVRLVREDGKMGFTIGRDWVLKACLMLTDADVRFKVKNFDQERVHIIEERWSHIHDCIVASFKLLNQLGMDDRTLTSKNAVIPIAYYLYKQSCGGQPLFRTINSLTQHAEERRKISQWLYMALLKGVFGGQPDSVLSKMQRVVSENLSLKEFPLTAIVQAFKATPKDLRFDEEYLNGLLDTQHREARCRSILLLLHPQLNENYVFHIDHLHPQSAFNSKKLNEHKFLENKPELREFYLDQAHWNSIANLHLLNSGQNGSKNDASLKAWIEADSNNMQATDILLSEDIDLSFENFPEFYHARRHALLKRLKSVVALTSVEETGEDAESAA